MVGKLDKIMTMNVEEVIASPLSLDLLKLYSIIFLAGAQPRTCAASQREYYKKLKENYQMAKQKLTKTHMLNWAGRRYIPGVFDKAGKLVAGHLHIHSEYLTDEKAVEYLKIGALKEKDFAVLPESYKSKAKKQDKESDLM
jgi:hypothetical protein